VDSVIISQVDLQDDKLCFVLLHDVELNVTDKGKDKGNGNGTEVLHLLWMISDFEFKKSKLYLRSGPSLSHRMTLRTLSAQSSDEACQRAS